VQRLDLRSRISAISSVTSELEETLQKLDAREASLLERLVRDALALVGQGNVSSNSADSRGWPPGYFEQTAGSFANETLDIPDDPPPTANPEW